MTRKTWFRGAALAGLVLVAASIFFVFSLRRSGLPARDGEHEVAGLGDQVEVRWDRWAVPHVTAASAEDVFAAQGWLHANDRFTQMELGRRAAFGRLAEILGEPAYEVDVYFRHLRFRHAVQTLWDDASPSSKRWLEAYARGVNAWLLARGSDLPPSLRILGVDPEPWEPIHSLAFVLLMSRDLSFWNDRPEEERLSWVSAFGLEGLRQLLGIEGIHISPGVSFSALDPKVPIRQPAPVPPTEKVAVPVDGTAPGSNNWAVAGTRTASGEAIVANDPHLVLSLPSIWYQMLMRSPEYEAAGMSIPGLPGVVLGRGPRVAWAFTNAMLDDHDLAIELLDEEARKVQRGLAKWNDVTIEEEVVGLRGGEERIVEVRSTEIGPLLEADQEARLPARSLAWTAYHGGDPLAALVGASRAISPEELFMAVEPYVCPAQNLVAAFSTGEIAYTVIGGVPERVQGDGRLPGAGLDPRDRWSGVRPARTPRQVDPPEGFLVTANDDAHPPGSTPLVADFLAPHRGDRIRERLMSRSDWTWKTTAELQTDIVARDARAMVAALGADAGAGAFDGAAGRAYEMLASWDGTMAADGPASGPAALYTLAERHLVDAFFADEAEVAGLEKLGNRSLALRLLSGEMSPEWFDDRRTAETIEERGEVAASALAAAWAEGVARWGEDTGSWSYGDLHHLVLRHQLDAVPLLGTWMRRGPYRVPGSSHTVNALAARWVEDGSHQEVAFGPSMRWITDWSEPGRAYAVLPGGQSGHPADPHYDDQIELFLAGEVRVAPWSEEEVEQATVGRLVLHPDTR